MIKQTITARHDAKYRAINRSKKKHPSDIFDNQKDTTP
jgi:hypothetical protein